MDICRNEFIDLIQKKRNARFSKAEIEKNGGVTKKECREFLLSFIDAVQDALSRGNSIKITDFGTFKLRDVKEHEGVDPRNGQPIHIGRKVTPAFKFGTKFRDYISGCF